MPEDAQPLSEDKIVSMLRAGIDQSVGYSESRLSKERQDVLKYLYGDRPRHNMKGTVSYVALDVYDAHEQMKAQLLETFSANSRPVVFAPVGPQDVQLAREGTEACSHAVYSQNPGYAIMRTVIDDGLAARAGIVKVWWEEKFVNDRQEVSGVKMDDVATYLVDNPDAQLEEVELEADDNGVRRAAFTAKKDISQVRIKPLAPERFGISGRARSIEEADLVFDWDWKTLSELRKEGYDDAILEDLNSDESNWLTTEPEEITRFEQTDDLITREDAAVNEQEARRMIRVYECYAELDVDGKGITDLYKITLAGDKILDREMVTMKPYVAFVPLPRPHSFWGLNYDKLVIPTQNLRTALIRSIGDHALITNNPRYLVKNGALKNPRELMENRIGGLVNTNDTQFGVVPLQHGALNPFVFQTIALLDSEKEERTGISKLSQGLNKDAVSKQNSQGMIQDLISVSQIRQKIVARNFAEEFLGPLYLRVYKLLLENADPKQMIQVAGSWQQIDITNWPERNRVQVTFALGYGEQDKQATKFLTIHKLLGSDPLLSPLYGREHAYTTIKQAMEATGILDVENYLTAPKDAPAPQPDPMQQAELQVKQADAQVKQANAQAAVEKLKLDQQKVALQTQLEMERIRAEHSLAMAKLQLERDKLTHKVAVDTTELAFQQDAAQDNKLQAFAEPTH